MADKLPYTLAFKLKSMRPDAVGAALAELHDLTSESDESGEVSATLTIESTHERALNDIREAFERWLYGYEIGLECEVVSKAPGLRPETLARLRAIRTTPMDRAYVEFRVAGEE